MGKQDYEAHQFTLAVDCIIFGFSANELNILLIHRGFAPEEGKWSLMGGFVNPDEDLDQAPVRILHELTGLNEIYLEQVTAFGKKHRDPGARVISVAYSALIRTEDYDIELIKKHNAHWFPISNYPDLIFDHKEMVQAAISQIRVRARLRPIGFNLLTPKFTLPQLQSLYESIYDHKLDDRNFRRRIQSLGILQKLEEKFKGDSKKGAFLFKFDKEAYDRLLKESEEMTTLLTLF
ncbi:MAG: NUDIX domain-containing protein [Bacteroidota bacterium]